MSKLHSFHIPVMGIGFTIDTPIRVAHYGIDSVIFISDDILIEKMRKMYCDKFKLSYTAITEKTDDFRAKRITSYLNLVNKIAKQNFERLKNIVDETDEEIKKYFNLLSDNHPIKKQFKAITANRINLKQVNTFLKDNLSMGSIDVNIMTKLDKDNYKNNTKLPIEYNDAHAALRGYANSNLESSIVFSAGMNPRLYGYIENFEDFFPDKHGHIKKKIILKVSDYRSALIQGKFLAKKGLWVSEYRIESGLNCGGHAFATEGFLMGPILSEFKDNRIELGQTIHEILVTALASKNRCIPNKILPLKITAQGGVGTAEEHQFIIDQYQVDSVGWGTPFLLVPEVTNVDDTTREKLIKAKEKDLYLSNISPLGVPFNNLRGNTKDLEKLSFIAKGRPGSSCPKKFLSINKEFTERSICTASRQYQHLKLKQLEKEKNSREEYNVKYKKVVESACLCVGLGTSALLINNLDHKVEGDGVLVCPGPNMAYFSKTLSLKEMTNHIYGKGNVITRTDRPHMFIKELSIYIDYLKDKIEAYRTNKNQTTKQLEYLSSFVANLSDGVDYYYRLFESVMDEFEMTKITIFRHLSFYQKALFRLMKEIQGLPEKSKLAHQV